MSLKPLIVTLAITLAIFTTYRARAPISLSEIEVRLLSEELPELALKRQVADALRYFEKVKLTDSTRSRIDALLPKQSFLTQADLDLVEQILKLDRGADQDSLFFETHKLRLHSLFFRILNDGVRIRYFAAASGLNPNQKHVVEWIAERYARRFESRFLKNQLKFYRSLSGEALKEKQQLERYLSESYKIFRKDSRKAMPFFGEGLRLARKLQDRRMQLAFSSRLQHTLLLGLGLSNLSIQLGHVLEPQVRSLGFLYLLPRIHLYLGNARMAQGDYGSALTQFQQAYDVAVDIGHHDFKPYLIERLGVAHSGLGEVSAATRYYDELSKLEGDRESLNRVRALIGHALIYFDTAQYEKAERVNKEAIRMARKLEFWDSLIVALGNLGVLYAELGDYARALDLQQQALQVALANGSPFSLPSTLTEMTRTYLLNKDPDRAKLYAEQAAGYLQTFDFGKTNVQAHMNNGQTLVQIGDYENALRFLQYAADTYRENRATRDEMVALNLIGETYWRMGDLDSGLAALQKALALRPEIPESRQRWQTHFTLGRLFSGAKQVDQARRHFEQSIALVHDVAEQLKNNEQRSFFGEKIQPVFEEMVLLLLDQKEDEHAFAVAEEMRAQVFKILFREKVVLTNRQSQTAQASFARDLQGASSKSSELIVQIQERMQSKTALVEYEVTDSALVIWVISPDQFNVVRTNSTRQQLERLIADLRQCTDNDNLTSHQALRSTFERSMEIAQQLHERMITPVDSLIATSDLIYFVPDESLHLLPFGLLLGPNDRHFIEDKAFATIPSAETWVYQFETRSSPTKDREAALQHLLAIAPTEDLPHSLDEIDGVAGLATRSTLLKREAATEAAVRRELAENSYQIVLFAAHGVVSNRAANSGLRLHAANGSQTSKLDDGALTVDEIYDLPMPSADLVYLSSCESASGRVFRGEGLVGIQRAFLVAGANSVVANLWKIEDKSAKDLTLEFFTNWAHKGANKAEALRQAQLNIIDRLRKDPLYDHIAHPYFWASAILSGSYN